MLISSSLGSPAGGGDPLTAAGIVPILDAYNTANRSIGSSGNIYSYNPIPTGGIDTVEVEDTAYISMASNGALTVAQDAWLALLFDVAINPDGATSGVFAVAIGVTGAVFGGVVQRSSRNLKSALIPLADAGSEINNQLNTFSWFPAGAVLTPTVLQTTGSSKNLVNIAWVVSAYT